MKRDSFRPTLNQWAENLMRGLPERIIAILWTQAMTHAMRHTGKGHRLNALSHHSGKTYWVGDDWLVDRRADKIGPRFPKALRAWNARTGSKPNEV